MPSVMTHCRAKLQSPLPAFRLLSGLLLLALSSASYGFGREGHLIVCEIAFAQLQPVPRAMVEQLLGNKKPLAFACLWPDEVKYQADYEWSQPYHYVNLPRRARDYDAARDCPGDACLIEAIKRFAAELENQSLPVRQRARALKFLGHFVGDLHQPLHSGYGDDRGGNEYQVSVAGEGTNLHTVWDTLLVKRVGRWPQVAASVARDCRVDGQHWDLETEVMRWFAESRQLVLESVYPPGHKLDEAYLERFEPLTRERLCLAGKRLGTLLNALLRDADQP